MEDVPAMDSTGLVAFESAIQSLKKHNCVTIVCGLAAQPAQALEKAHFEENRDASCSFTTCRRRFLLR